MDYEIILKINKQSKINYYLVKDKNLFMLDEKSNIDNYESKLYKSLNQILEEYKTLSKEISDYINYKITQNKKFYDYFEERYNKKGINQKYLEHIKEKDNKNIETLQNELEFYQKIIKELENLEKQRT